MHPEPTAPRAIQFSGGMAANPRRITLGPQALTVGAAGTAFVPKDCVQEVRTAARTTGFQEQLSAAAGRRRAKRASVRAALRTQDARLRTHRCRSAAALACAAERIDTAARRKRFARNPMSDLCACWWPFGRRNSERNSDGWSPSPLIQARTKPIAIVGEPLVEQACRKASFVLCTI